MSDEARKQTEDEVTDDLELTDDAATDVAGGRDPGSVSLGDLVIQKPIDRSSPLP
jgi:type VI protein secretion system component Hcp